MKNLGESRIAKGLQRYSLTKFISEVANYLDRFVVGRPCFSYGRQLHEGHRYGMNSPGGRC